MRKRKLFLWLNRANSVLLFVLLAGAICLTLWSVIESNYRRHRRAVEVAASPADESSPRVELVLGGVHGIEGRNDQYVTLKSTMQGGKFSGGYSGGEIRNVLFLIGDNMEPRWLFPNHNNMITSVYPLAKPLDNEKKIVVAFYYAFVSEDSNQDGSLDEDDLVTLAVSAADGSGFVVVEDRVRSVIDWKVLDKGKHLTLLFQKDGQVFLQKTDLATRRVVSSKSILSVEN